MVEINNLTLNSCEVPHGLKKLQLDFSQDLKTIAEIVLYKIDRDTSRMDMSFDSRPEG
jgi:hypothetical protein